MKKIVIGILFILILSFGLYYFYMYNNLLDEYQRTNFYNKAIINGSLYGDDIFIFRDNRPYINYDIVKFKIDENVYLSNSKARMFIPKDKINLRLENSQISNFVIENLKTINIPLFKNDTGRFVDLEILSKIYGLTYEYYEEYNVLFLENRNLEVVEVKNNSKLYGYDGLNYFHIGKSSKEKDGYILESSDEYSYIFFENGKLAYIKNDSYKTITKKEFALDIPVNNLRQDNNFKDDFIISWHQISGYLNNPNLDEESKLPIDVISPTWFSLNVDGIVLNEGDLKYVEDAHEKGYKVWGLYSNNFDPDWTNSLFQSNNSINESIAQILYYSALYNLDGINFDFENMYLKNKNDYVLYISKISQYLSFQNLRTSVDVTVPWGSDMWSKVYDRELLSKEVDYVCLMAYDEFWASSKVAGPVASLPWTEKAIVESLKLIPREKLVLGIPFYMRKWEITSGGSAKSKAIGFNSFEKIKSIDDNIIYDEKAGQNFLEYSSEGKNYKIWIEDSLSIGKRFDLKRKYGLNAIGIWSRIFANDETWNIVESNRDW